MNKTAESRKQEDVVDGVSSNDGGGGDAREWR
jgi:hypothetical protein